MLMHVNNMPGCGSGSSCTKECGASAAAENGDANAIANAARADVAGAPSAAGAAGDDAGADATDANAGPHAGRAKGHVSIQHVFFVLTVACFTNRRQSCTNSLFPVACR